jgi:hypothetical protein
LPAEVPAPLDNRFSEIARAYRKADPTLRQQVREQIPIWVIVSGEHVFAARTCLDRAYSRRERSEWSVAFRRVLLPHTKSGGTGGKNLSPPGTRQRRAMPWNPLTSPSSGRGDRDPSGVAAVSAKRRLVGRR